MNDSFTAMLLSGLTRLGTEAPGQAKALNTSEADAAAVAWRQRRQAAMDATMKAAPPQEGIGRALLGSIIAGVLAGAGGAGGEGGQNAMDTALQTGQSLTGDRNKSALAQHAAEVEAANKTLESYDDLTKGMRMILQAQPGLVPAEMMPLAAEIAFPGSGLSLKSKSEGLPQSSVMMLDAIDAIIKSNDVKDAGTLSRLHNLSATLRGVPKDQLLSPTDFVDGNLLSESWLIENAINGRELAEKQNRGQRININDVDYKPKEKVTYSDQLVSAIQRRAKLMIDQQLTREEALAQLDPADQDIIAKEMKESLPGMLDADTATDIAMRVLLKGGETQQILGGGLGDENYWNKLVGEYMQKEKEARQKQLQRSVERQIEQEQSRLMREEALDEAEAEEQAVELLKKRLRKGGTWTTLDPAFRKRYGE